MKLVCVIQVSPSAFHGGLTNRVSKDAPSMVLDSRDLTTRGHIPPSRLFIPVQYIFHCIAIPMIFPLYSLIFPRNRRSFHPFIPLNHHPNKPGARTPAAASWACTARRTAIKQPAASMTPSCQKNKTWEKIKITYRVTQRCRKVIGITVSVGFYFSVFLGATI